MSKIVYICYKNPALRKALHRKVEQITVRISPDNITASPTKIVNYDGVIYGIYNPVSIISETNRSVLLGVQIGNDPDWWKIQSAIPDGSFALFRSNDSFVEVASDAAGSRSIWYVSNNDLFISSTSQRAIVAVLGDFQLNKKVLTWMLSSGTLGPNYSWDSRINLLPPCTVLTLDRLTWELKIKTKKIEFIPEHCSDKNHENSLKNSLIDTFLGLNLDLKKWVLPVSGGYDSRSILLFLKLVGANIKELKTATWGMKESLHSKSNDANVASKLAHYFNIPHRYYTTDLSVEPIEDVFNRFICCGEGRIDHIGGYLDGFKIWKGFFEDNIEGVISGHVGFTQKPALSFKNICSMQGMNVCDDYANLTLYKEFDLPYQEIPANLMQQNDESLEDFRDRLYREFRVPLVLTALNEIKCSYIEVLNPLLSKRVLDQSSKLPQHLRSGKKLFKKIVNSIGPDIAYATQGANASKKHIFTTKAATEFFLKSLKSSDSRELFSDDFTDYIIRNLKVREVINKREKTLKQKIAWFLPQWFLKNKALLGIPKSKLDFSIIAFRMYIIIKMNHLLIEDAKSTSKKHFFINPS